MKKLIYVFALGALVTVSSCKKDDETTPQENCNCGLVTEDDNGTTNGDSWYSIDIRNSCTDNVKTFYLTQGDWVNAHVGNDFCITNETSW